MFVINGEVWRLKIVDSNYPLLLKPDGTYSIGVCDDRYKIICISNLIYGQQFKRVLCHEIVHAAMFSYNIYLDYETEELLANIIAHYGHEIINVTDILFKKMQRGYYL